MANSDTMDEKIVNEEKQSQTQDSQSDTAETKVENTDKKEEKEDNSKSGRKKKAASELEQKEKEIIDMRYKMSDINDKYLRLSAEFDNYRKRTLKEKSELIKTAGGQVLTDILPVIDDFERALQAMEKASDVAAVKEGVDLIFNKIRDFVKAKGIVEIDALNQNFDTDLHEALTKIPAPNEALKGKVVDVVQRVTKLMIK